MPTIPFGSGVTTLVPLTNRDTHNERSILNYDVIAALRHKGAKGGLILFNPLTKCDVIRRTYQIVGPTVP